MRLRDGRRLTALDLQWAYFERASSFVRRPHGADATSRPTTCCTAGRACWTGSAATRCAAPTSWTGWPSCGCWRATATREDLGWALAKLQLVDLQYSDVRPEKGLYHRLVARGSMKTLLDRRRGDPAR